VFLTSSGQSLARKIYLGIQWELMTKEGQAFFWLINNLVVCFFINLFDVSYLIIKNLFD
jgi:hypothetical protein